MTKRDRMKKEDGIKKIAPPDEWKKKIVKGKGWDLKEIETRAGKAIESLQSDYLPAVRRDLEAVEQAVAEAKSCPLAEREQALRKVHQVSHDVRGQAGTFGYDLITTIGASLCNYIEEAENINSVQLKVIEIHADAMRAVIANDIRGNGGEMGRQLLISMKVMVNKTLAAGAGRDGGAMPGKKARRATH
jgi:chemotaxis protein histidine kinase CheA